MNLWLGAGGLAMAGGAYALSFLPSPYAQSSFWTSSPCFFFLRAGVMTMAVPIAFLWERRPRAETRWSPLTLLGRSSLFIYWIHVEMVYGVMSTPLHHALTLGESWMGLAVFSALMVGCALAKDRVKAWWRHRPIGGRPLAPQSVA